MNLPTCAKIYCPSSVSRYVPIDALSRLIWAGNTGTPTGGDHCGNAPTGTTLSTYQQSFSYDSLDRMASGPAGSVTYGDINHVHAATTLGSMPNPYTSYDAMGNMTCRNTDTGSGHTCGSSPTGALMSYDNEGRLASWTAPNGTTATDTFLYDGEGNRVLQETSTSSITDIITFDGYSETVLTGGTITPTKYYNVNGQRVAMRTSSTLSYLLADALGSSTVALTSSGSTQAVQLFAPYGSIRYSQGSMPTTYNFTGQRLDSQTGLLYYNFRYYDPLSGRFVRADTTQTNAGGMDPYAYVGDNPETKDDSTGHCPWCILAIGAAVGALLGAGITYGINVYNNYQNHVQNPWTQNIDWGAVGYNALIGAAIGASLGLDAAMMASQFVTPEDIVPVSTDTVSTGDKPDEEYIRAQIARAEQEADNNLKPTGGRDPRATGSIAQTGDQEVTGVSGPWKTDSYYTSGRCAEFNCAVKAKIWALNTDPSDRGEINVYVWQVNSKPPCGNCQNTLLWWANLWGNKINVYWLDENGTLNSDTYGPRKHGW